ncbi:MAG: KR domain-containing protein [Planctomycetales bacterium]|nr:KR domain-containing protein [Planctomycetales bacterium]
MTRSIRSTRPQRQPDGGPELNAYAAASLTARLLGFQGRREVIDAACSSSLIALHHAATAINNDRLDLAIVGGATYNNVDNLALFSQTGACSASGSYPFDSRASGLVSSEGYVAVLIARRSLATSAGLPILATLRGVGISSDGKGKGLWAPRSEGQQLAMRRAIDDAPPLQIDYLECHATSTQIGDATELESLDALLRKNRDGQLLIGSVKSNLGHLLEAAGLVGLVKCLIAMRRGEIPPSINFKTPTKSFDWQQASLRVVDSVQPWPTREPKRQHLGVAAVNAFGIGGLNAHAVIGQSTNRNRTSTGGKVRVANNVPPTQPIAIVGRGLVLPGAANVAEFAALLDSEVCHLQDPPVGRWPIEPAAARGDVPKLIGLDAVDRPYHVPHAMGGYIHGFKFDAQSYRIPPKVVRNANPAQLMLIESVRQAIDELDGGQWSIDRRRCGVTIGTMFGGQFSNELQIGLRLPEICLHLTRSAISRGVSPDVAAAWAEAYRRAVLSAYPALLDETGGFTASTLASRISRTFDLMGGACAVDADDASSSLAILTAAEQLSAGQVDTVICGTAQRSIDLVALEQLYRNDRLARTPMVEELIRDPSKIFPAEGVAIIVLQRLSDAKKSNRRILGTIHCLGESFVSDVKSARVLAARQSDDSDHYPSTQIVRQIGHLGGGHGLVQSIAATIAVERHQRAGKSTIVETAADGYQIRFNVGSENQPIHHQSVTATPNQATTPDHATTTRPSKFTNHPAVIPPVEQNDSVLSVRLHAPSAGELSAEIQRMLRDGFDESPARTPVDSCHAIIVGAGRDELHSAAKALLDGPLASGQSGTAAKHAALVKLNDVAGDRIAWTFPGQGSQYSAVPRTFQWDPDCQQSIDSFDAQLKSLGLEPVGHRLDDPDRQLGRDVWWTQAWLLATGTALTDSLLRRGMRPDVVLGHSFGECTAAWAAGVMSIRGAIEFAKSRSDAVTIHGGPNGELLSVRSEPSLVHSILRRHDTPCVVTHHNSPNQTVIAGSPGDIDQAKRHLSAVGIASVVIAVPAAFHTPNMTAARDVLAARQSGAIMRPPRFGFLSATQNRYLAEPEDVKSNLIKQLVQPVGFCGAVQRLVSDGCGLLIEVGPGNVLTRLSSASVNGRAICLSADDPQLNIACCRRLIDLASELFSGSPVQSPETAGTKLASSESLEDTVLSSDAVHSPSKTRRFSVVDVTRRGRRGESSVEYTSVTNHSSSRTTPSPIHEVERRNGGFKQTSASAKPAMSQSQSTVALADAGPSKPGMGKPLSNHANAITTNPANSAEAAKRFLFDLVVDLTGYEPEIIDFDADLEAELGVDSIKKAQLIGELVQWAGLNLTTQDVKLADYQSMSDILALVPGDSHVADAQDHCLDDDNALQPPRAVTVRQATVAETPEVDADALRRLMIDLLVDQTGYDEDIIDMDADLESELGVDSIKRAQLFGELEQQFDLPPIQQTDLKFADFPTLASIHDFIMDQAATRKKKSPTSLTDVFCPDVPGNGTHRFTLGLRRADRLPGMPDAPSFHGSALVVGDNSIADAIVCRLKRSGVPVDHLRRPQLGSIDAALDAMWTDDASQHLFITTPHDSDACWSVDDWSSFSARRDQALQVPYRICQRWMQRVIDDGVMDRSSMVTVVRGGGNFGLDDASQVLPPSSSHAAVHVNPPARSNESGAMAGLTKAMLIEAWMRGYRDTPMLIVDVPDEHSLSGESNADQIVEGIWRELAVPSYDEEVIVSGSSRAAIKPLHSPLSSKDLSEPVAKTRFPLTRGGNWVIAGGGRGITAMTAMELAERHDLTLQLLGMAPQPRIDQATREHAIADRADLRRKTMRRVQSQGENPVKHWRQFEKAIEIDLTLQECRRRGINAKYHSVDISDADAVQQTLAMIRNVDGPIRGVIQGAGSGQDARFDRKRPDKVNQCLSAKIDGTAALAHATRNDPLEWFIGFGSISGRFGANGHTDYSAANDALAKMIGDLGRRRDQTRCVTFHWHAWGDVGMATKPEAKLALDMIGMKFMPAQEGLLHFLNEVELGGDAAEVLITDRRYVRKFFPCGEDDRPFAAPLILPNRRLDQVSSSDPSDNYAVTLDPTRDLFLKEHLVAGKPTLPMVIAIEMMAQAAKLDHGCVPTDGPQVSAITGIRAIAPLKANSDDAFAIELVRQSSSSAGSTWSLNCDLRRRDGRIVEPGRKHFVAAVEFSDPLAARKTLPAEHLRELPITENPVGYLPPESAVYHGPSLRCLRSIGFAVDPASDSIPIAIGTIVAPSPSHLCGEDRPLSGWVTSPATMDAMLYAAGMLAGSVGGRPSLPVSIDKIWLGRLPQPGEPLRVIVKWLVETEDRSGGILSVMLVGQNDDLIANLTGYRIGWLGG